MMTPRPCWRLGGHAVRAAWSAASCAHHCDVTGTETRDSLLFERAASTDLAFWTGTRPQVVSMFLSIVPFLYSKRTAAARSLVSLIEKRTFCGVSSEPLVEQPRSGAEPEAEARAAWGLRGCMGQARGLIQIQHNTRAHTLMATARRFKSKVRRGGIKVIATLLPQRA
jgi:hypothetical protein